MDGIDEVLQRQGWNDDTLRKLALRFIVLRGLEDDFRDYLELVAQEENEERDGE